MTERGSAPGSAGSEAESDTELSELAGRSAALEGQPAEAILAWVFEHYAGRRIGLSSAFGPEGCALIHLARALRPDVPVYTIDTGYLFAETLAVREAFRAQGADIRVVEPLVTIRAQAERHGPDLFARDPDACCEIRKVEPMRRVLDRLDVWITAIRRDQAVTRQGTPILGTARRGDGSLVVKVAPLAAWTRKDTWRYLIDHEVPYNPLLDAGYTSIGCEPCTARPPGDDERGGRWSGTGKTECGIHHL
ncbi:phosphoadenylyl-sulfate reductase [Nannocystis pusilla]|uniref:Adenosine 5'-phosphosulfate reductase n=1 Tax=Nannocystis pusilla TaxID=889268 RepID=A0ABS7TS62_9BACT|nr:phosphoadenylyl-sulfate reductase [Nannocystis pusilla]